MLLLSRATKFHPQKKYQKQTREALQNRLSLTNSIHSVKTTAALKSQSIKSATTIGLSFKAATVLDSAQPSEDQY